MRTTLNCEPLLGVCCLLISLPALAGESGHNDHERPLVQQGVLGTVNVLRELDNHTFTNRVTVTANVEGKDSTRPEYTIDGSGKIFRPNVAPSKPLVLTYTLPGPRTVSSLVITYEYAANDAPPAVRLEGSSDGGKTWFQVFNRKARKSDFLKCFRPAKVNMLRLTQEGDGSDKCCRRTVEVFVYADPDAPLPLFGGQDSGAFNFLRGLWYADKISQVPSRENNAVWTGPGSGTNVPDNLFRSEIAGMHRGCWGEGKEVGKRLYLRFDLDRAYPMNFGLIGCVEVGKNEDSWTLAGESQAEFYTANGRLDPSTLKGSSIKDLTGQGWILQKTWDKDPNPCKGFLLERPGKYNQMLLVWDCKKKWENNRFGHLEMFGFETPAKAGKADKRQAETRLGVASNSSVKPVEPVATPTPKPAQPPKAVEPAKPTPPSAKPAEKPAPASRAVKINPKDGTL